MRLTNLHFGLADPTYCPPIEVLYDRFGVLTPPPDAPNAVSHTVRP